MITVRLLLKDYNHLAKCLIPIGAQINMSMDDRIVMLKRHCRQFTKEEARDKISAHTR